MTFQEYKQTYHRMPAEFRLHGDMPTQIEVQEDVDVFVMLEARKKRVAGIKILRSLLG